MDPGESPLETASRELREETGFVAAEVEVVGTLFPNPALNTARVHIAVARGCVRTEERQLDPFERIDRAAASSNCEHPATITASSRRKWKPSRS